MKVLGVDPGFANFGWAIAEVNCNGVAPITCGVFHTKKTDRKGKVLAPDDEFRRSKELYTAFEHVVDRFHVRMICAEGMSSPRNAVTVRMLGYAWGILASICERMEIPLAQVNPKQLKKKLCGRISVTDQELHAEVRRRYSNFEAMVDCIGAKTKHEHAYDAMAAIEACRDGEVFRTLIANLKDVA